MDILLVNDDGIHSPGLRVLYQVLQERGHKVSVVAPDRQHSGAGHSLTVFEPLIGRDIRENGFEGYAVAGTPADCVKLALGGFLGKWPNLVISGINLGPNVGPDLNYSGTVGAAAEAAHAGLPGLAVSQLAQEWAEDLSDIANHVAKLAEEIKWQTLPHGCVINVNYPNSPVASAGKPVVCAQSQASWENVYEKRTDPRGRAYWWLKGALKLRPDCSDCDLEMLLDGHITLTPLKFEYTDLEGMSILKNMEIGN